MRALLPKCRACIAAIKAGRHYIGYDIEEKYMQLAERRIKEYKKQLEFSKVGIDEAL